MTYGGLALHGKETVVQPHNVTEAIQTGIRCDDADFQLSVPERAAAIKPRRQGMAELCTFAAILSMGIFTQAATGFAGGLVIVPLMLWAGHGIPEAQAALLVATIPQNVLGYVQFYRTQPMRELVLPATLRLSLIPVGVLTLYWVDTLPLVALRQFMGAVVIGCVSLLLVTQPQPREALHVGWTWVTFTVSGFFAGLTGTGGQFMVLWVQAHRWSTEKSRAFLFFIYLLSTPLLLALLTSRSEIESSVPS